MITKIKRAKTSVKSKTTAAKIGVKSIINRTPLLTPEDIQARIQERAYYLSEQRGFIPGYEQEDWFQAETQIKRELKLK